MKERIKYLRKDLLHITMDQFGEKIGLARSSISNLENGNRDITDRTIKDICREYGVREEWLRTGAGEPFGAQTRNQQILAFVNRMMMEEDTSFKKRLVDALSQLNESEWELLEKIALLSIEKD